MDPSHIQEIQISAAVLTISTSRSEKEDKSGALIRDLLEKNSIPVTLTKVIPDQVDAIRSGLSEALQNANCVILTGGTGITSDDCTIEAVEPLFEKNLEGFGELFRWKSYEEIGTRTVLSRATAGIIGKKAVFCIPGSSNAANLATSAIIIPEIRHILTHANR